MAYQKKEIKVGLMVFISLLILGIFLLAIFGIHFGVKTNQYRIYLDYVGGISEGSLVKFMGMDVGQVSGISFADGEQNLIALELQVKADTPIKTDSRAFVTSIGLMTDHHIEINPGSPEAELLPSGSVLNTKKVLSFAQMSEALGDLNSQTQTLLARLNTVFDENNQAHLSSIAQNMDSLMINIQEPFLTTLSNLEKSSAELALISSDLREFMDMNDNNFSEFLANLKTTTDATDELIREIRSTVRNLELLMSANNANVADILENFQSTSQNLEEFSRIIKEQPWLLVRKSAPSERKY